jgi:hypothetical protein
MVAGQGLDLYLEAGGSRVGKSNQHVVPRDGGWAVRKQGSSRVTRVFDTQSEAVGFARRVAKKSSGDVFIHRADGTIRDRESYGVDHRRSHERAGRRD